MNLKLYEKIYTFLGINSIQLNNIINKAPYNYKKYKIPKKKGGDRSIYHPAKETKAVQYALMQLLLNKLPIHDIAVAYRRGFKSPLKNTAEKHAQFKYTVNIDIKNFFPSIKPDDLFTSIYLCRKEDIFTNEEKKLITNILFINMYNKNCLAVGAPSSPIISNIVMLEIDKLIITAAQRLVQNFALTRYADDITLSCNERGICNKFVDSIKKILETVNNPKLALNTEKTSFSSKGTKRYVLGLSIMPNSKISIGRERKRYIHHLLNKIKYNNINKEKYIYLRGMLSFILDVEPDFYNRLVIKYKEDVFSRLYNYS